MDTVKEKIRFRFGYLPILIDYFSHATTNFCILLMTKRYPLKEGSNWNEKLKWTRLQSKRIKNYLQLLMSDNIIKCFLGHKEKMLILLHFLTRPIWNLPKKTKWGKKKYYVLACEQCPRYAVQSAACLSATHAGPDREQILLLSNYLTGACCIFSALNVCRHADRSQSSQFPQSWHRALVYLQSLPNCTKS